MLLRYYYGIVTKKVCVLAVSHTYGNHRVSARISRRNAIGTALGLQTMHKSQSSYLLGSMSHGPILILMNSKSSAIIQAIKGHIKFNYTGIA